jgi:hypothetical protein
MKIATRRRTRSRGQALVEFALIFPVFMLILFGLFDVGRAVFAYTAITNAAREGARLAIVNQDEPSIGTQIDEQVTTTATAHCIFFIEPTSSFNTCDKGTDTPADACAAPPTVGCIAHVEVWTDYTPITPLISNIIGTLTLTANSESAVEFVCPNPGIPAWSAAGSCPKQP